MLTMGAKAEMLAKCLHILDVLVERVERRVAAGGAALAAMVEIHQLHVIGEWRQGGLEPRMVAARPAVNNHGDGPLSHDGPIWN